MKLAIVEDNTPLRENLALLLDGETDIEVTGHWGTAEEALLELGEAPPDILLVDISLPGMSGIELTRRLKNTLPKLEVMVHTIFDDRGNIFAAIKAGASSYILKGATPRELIEALFDLARGGAPMSPKIARSLITEFQGVEPTEEFLLTAREQEIIENLEKGLTYKELADKLSVSHHTVHTHIKNIYEKLHAKGRRDALAKAKKKGIL